MSDGVSVLQHEPKPTYYVVRMDGEGKAPTRGYPGRNMAHKAAEALAHRNPGVPFQVVKLKTTIKKEIQS